MNDPDKLPLAVQAMHMLVDELHPDDTVALVVYAGAAGAVLEPTEARDAREIHRALDRLSAGGSTARSNSVTWFGNASSRMAATMSGASVVRLTILLT